MIFKNILVPYDATKSSDIALKAALDLAKSTGSIITFLTCIPEKYSFGFFKTKSDKKILKKQVQVAEKKLSALKTNITKKGISCKTKIKKTDQVSSCIVDFAKKEKIDLILISKTHVGTYAEKIYRESTTNGIIESAKCSVLLLR